MRLLEESGTIRGYSALINDRAAASETIVIVQIMLERQTDEYLRRFEGQPAKIRTYGSAIS